MSEPRTIITDFETFFDTKGGYSLRAKGENKITLPEYILDPRFKVHGLAVDVDGKQDFIRPKQIPAFLESVSDDILVAHQGFFDFAIMQWRYKFRPAFMLDTLLLANHVLGSAYEGNSRNDLDHLASKLGLKPKGRLDFMDGVSEPDENQLVALSMYAKNDAALARGVLDALLPHVGNEEFELWLLDHTIRIYLEKWLTIDVAKLDVAKALIEEARRTTVADGGVDPSVLNSNKQFRAELGNRLTAAGKTTKRRLFPDEIADLVRAEKEAAKKEKREFDAFRITIPKQIVSPALPTKDAWATKTDKAAYLAAGWKEDDVPVRVRKPALSKSDHEFLALMHCGVPSVEALVKARLAERSAVTVSSRLATMRKYAGLGGIPVHLVYYGAHTGRFAGGGGFNFQNLTSPGRAADDFSRTVATAVRECIVPGEGQVFVPVDAAQIEARVEAWLADESVLTEAFRRKEDVYCSFVSGVLGEDIHKPTDADPKDTHSYLKLMRQVGKEAVLALGYSMGNDTFRVRLSKEKALVPMMAEGQKLDYAFTQGVVDHYRATYTQIVQFWEDLFDCFTRAIHGSTRRLRHLLFKKVGPRAVGIVLPSGRTLYYRDLRQEPEKTPNGKIRRVWKHGRGQKVYGGLLAENVTQAVARDILVEQGILACEQAGYPVVLHVHDEVVPRVPKAQAQECLAFGIKSLSTPPAWGQGLVLDAEGHIAENLSK
jgi:hypothetical protein